MCHLLLKLGLETTGLKHINLINFYREVADCLSEIKWKNGLNETIKNNLRFNIRMHEIIFTEEEYRRAIMRFLEICDAEPGTAEYDEALQLTKLMEDYENLSCYERRNLN
jgi:hypothetical protein